MTVLFTLFARAWMTAFVRGRHSERDDFRFLFSRHSYSFQTFAYNDDFINKEEVSLTSEPRNPEIAICQTLDAPDLVEAYEKGQLKGKLKEIAANLDEESNPVAMLLKKKK